MDNNLYLRKGSLNPEGQGVATGGVSIDDLNSLSPAVLNKLTYNPKVEQRARR
jgi:hypothetical protein